MDLSIFIFYKLILKIEKKINFDFNLIFSKINRQKEEEEEEKLDILIKIRHLV